MTSVNEVVNPINVLSLPNEVLDNILSYLLYEEISHVRAVCKRFDASAQRVLNQGFHKVEKFHAQCVRKLKDLLPRRESERRKHPLASHCDILTAIESRLSLLSMTFITHIKLQHCCFIPGKVLDELFRVLRLAATMKVPTRSYELLQELRDISSMAMEHFDDRIVPTLRGKISNAQKPASVKVCKERYLDSDPYTNMLKARKIQLTRVHEMHRHLQNKCMELEKDSLEYRRTIMEYRRRLNDVDRSLNEQNIILLRQRAQISIQDAKIEEITKRIVSYQEDLAAVVSQHKNHCINCMPCYCNCINNSALNEVNDNSDTDPPSDESLDDKRNSPNNDPPRKRMKKC